jgi:hypothetical protein
MLAAACAGQQKSDAAARDSVANKPVANASASGADADVSANGSGLPSGYVGRLDHEGMKMTDVKYTPSSGRWEVRTGPAHIIYATRDSARGTYTVSATFDQLEAPSHPEAYGVFIGGQNLDGPAQRYTYFIVRGTGETMVKVRDADSTRTVIGYKTTAPKADASGKATYRLAVRVSADSVRFLVDDKPAGAVARAAVPADGIVGLRINHNLHVMTGPVTIAKG